MPETNIDLDQKPRSITPFFLHCVYNDKNGNPLSINSEHVVAISNEIRNDEPNADHPVKTVLLTNFTSKYGSKECHVAAPLQTVKEIFKAHGYHMLTPDTLSELDGLSAEEIAEKLDLPAPK